MSYCEAFMDEAVALSRKHMERGEGGPFGCVIVKDGRIIGSGWNSVLAANDPTAHAEVNAIREACHNLGSYQLSGCEIYTSCEPCPMCMGAIYWARPSRVYYANSRHDAAAAGFDDSFIYHELPLPPQERTIQMIPVDNSKALAVMEDWKAKPDKESY